MLGRPNKPDHPWKRALSAKKAAQDRAAKKIALKNEIESPSKNPAKKIA